MKATSVCRCVPVLAIAVAFLCTPAMSQGAMINLWAKIDGSQETPAPTPSTAFGVGVFTYDTDTHVLTYKILYTESLLLGTETMAHIHGPAPAGMSASPLITLPLGEYKTGSADLDDYPLADPADLLADLWYVNIHSTAHTGGEIRGQIVPEPMTMGLLALGAVPFVLRRRFR